MKLLCTAGLVGLSAAVFGASTGSAQSVNDMVRTLNNVLNPGDAQRLEDQARRNGRLREERYWRDYRAGLESPDRYRRDYGDRDYGDRDRGVIVARATTAIGVVTLIEAIPAIGAIIVTNGITATINAENRDSRDS
jgi:hypothetical protein